MINNINSAINAVKSAFDNSQITHATINSQKDYCAYSFTFANQLVNFKIRRAYSTMQDATILVKDFSKEGSTIIETSANPYQIELIHALYVACN